MEIIIASDQKRENLFAEIRKDGDPWAEVILNSETQRFELTIFPRADGETIVVDLVECQRALSQAKQALSERGYRESALAL